MKWLFVKFHSTGHKVMVPVDKILYINEFKSASEHMKGCNAIITLATVTNEYNPAGGPEPVQLYVVETIDQITASLRVMYEPQ